MDSKKKKKSHLSHTLNLLIVGGYVGYILLLTYTNKQYNLMGVCRELKRWWKCGLGAWGSGSCGGQPSWLHLISLRTHWEPELPWLWVLVLCFPQVFLTWHGAPTGPEHSVFRTKTASPLTHRRKNEAETQHNERVVPSRAARSLNQGK